MSSSSESHGTHDLNEATLPMNDLDPKGLEAAAKAIEPLLWKYIQDDCATAIRAYLSATVPAVGELVERIGEIVYGRHERGFIMWPLMGGDRIKAALTAALQPQEE